MSELKCRYCGEAFGNKGMEKQINGHGILRCANDDCGNYEIIGKNSVPYLSALEARVKELEAENTLAINILDGNADPINWRAGGTELLRKLCEHLEAYREYVDEFHTLEQENAELKVKLNVKAVNDE